MTGYSKRDAEITGRPGYSNPRMRAEISGWPMGGSRRGDAIFEIEQVAGKGERGVRTTYCQGKYSAPKKLTYASKARIVDGDDGKIYIAELSPMYWIIVIMQSNMQFEAEVIHKGNDRYDDLLKLFEG